MIYVILFLIALLLNILSLSLFKFTYLRGEKLQVPTVIYVYLGLYTVIPFVNCFLAFAISIMYFTGYYGGEYELKPDNSILGNICKLFIRKN